MTRDARTVRLAETYCPHCHLATRADHRWCLHCRKPLPGAQPERPRPPADAHQIVSAAFAGAEDPPAAIRQRPEKNRAGALRHGPDG